MYPFTINSVQNTVPYDNLSTLYSPLFNNDNNIQQISNLDAFSSSSNLFNLSSPFQYEDAVFELTWQQLYDLFFHSKNPGIVQTENNIEEEEDDLITRVYDVMNNEIIRQEQEEEPTKNQLQKVSRKRGSKKDRHSKITTAHGPRDRRMRLSLPIARKFFGLQDMLGFDKASKTIEWLLTQSNSAIERIVRDLQHAQGRHTCSTNGIANSISSTSECEVISGDQSVYYTKETPVMINDVKGKKDVRRARHMTNDPISRESRKIARERAKRRTMEKRKLQNESKIESLGEFGEGDEKWGTQNAISVNTQMQYQGVHEFEHLRSQVITSNWNTPAFCNFEEIEDIPIEHQDEGSFWQ